MSLPKSILVTAGLLFSVCASAQDVPLTCRDADRPSTSPALAVELYSRCLAEPGLTEDRRANTLYRRGLAHQSSGRMMEAATDLRDALSLRPQWADAHLARGIVMSALNESENAYDHFTAALRIDPDFIEARRNRAIILGVQGQLDRARADLTVILRLQPVSPDAYFARGELEAAQKQIAEAIDDFTQAIALRPDWPECYRARGEARLADRDHAGAVADFSSAIDKEHPSPWLILLKRGAVHEKMRNRQLAISDYRTALVLNPAFDNARAQLHRLGVSANPAQSAASGGN